MVTIIDNHESTNFDLFDVELTPQMAHAIDKIVSNVGGAGGNPTPTSISQSAFSGVFTVEWSASDRNDGPLVDVSTVVQALEGTGIVLIEMRSYHEYGTTLTLAQEGSEKAQEDGISFN